MYLRCIDKHVPYHRAAIGEAEIAEVVAALKSGWLTTGPRTAAFEQGFSQLKKAPCVAVNSCTAGIFLSLRSLNLQPGDEVLTTPMTFVSTANSIVHAGGRVVFADIERSSMNVDPAQVARRITKRTRAILPVHIGGNPCEMDQIMDLAQAHGLEVIEDCAHAIEAEFEGRPVGTFGYSGSFSFYPTKNITTGEGGMVTCRDESVERIIRLLSRHGLDKGTFERMEVEGQPLYDVVLPGYKCNMNDLQAALGLAQMQRLEEMYARRVSLRRRYEELFGKLDSVQVISQNPKGKSALHLFLLLLNPEVLRISREEFIHQARVRGVELSVNYTPIHLFSWYRNQFCGVPGAFKEAEYCGANVLSLPFYPAMSDDDVEHVGEVLLALLAEFRR